jgi:UDP-N-acetyl-D-mannosaminuronate dehydrogenase
MSTVITRQSLEEKIRNKTAVVGVVGLGYVGLPLVAGFARSGFPVVGFDIDPAKVASLEANRSYIQHFPNAVLEELHRDHTFSATSDFSRLSQADAIVICVPTPLTAHREPDLTYIQSTAKQIAETARPGQLIILESTTYPGTTEEILQPALEGAGLVLDRDFFLAYSPEREDPNNPRFTLRTIPKIVGGVTPRSGEVAALLYSAVVDEVVPVTNARVAEATKLVENIFRSVNIALVNELKVCFDKMGIDVWEVLEAATTKPFGFMKFEPGPGLGGHCLGGSESVRVRSSVFNTVLTLRDLFERYRGLVPTLDVGDAEVLLPQDLEALSIDPENGTTQWKAVSYLFRRRYDGPLLDIAVAGNVSLRTTDRHPMLVVSGENLQVREARELKVGDRLPRFCANAEAQVGGASRPTIDLLEELPPAVVRKLHVRVKGRPWSQSERLLKGRYGWQIRDSIRRDSLAAVKYLDIEHEIGASRDTVLLLSGKGSAHTQFPALLELTPRFCRFLGYFLSEGCITEEKGNPRVRLTFNRDEHEFIDDVVQILSELGVPVSRHDDRTWYSTTLRAGSLILGHALRDVLHTGAGSLTMRVPDIIMGASVRHHEQVVAGLLRGDGDVEVTTGRRTYVKNKRLYRHQSNSGQVGYFSSSPELFAQAEALLQGLGFTPLRKKGKPHLRMAGASQLSRLATFFDGQKAKRLERLAAARIRQASPRSAIRWAGGSALRVERVSPSNGSEDVYSLEVPGSHTFAATGGIFVHNCIPIDPFYLTWKARQYGVTTRFIELAGEINTAMPAWVVQKLADALNERGKSVKGSRILVLGVAYKKNVDDVRESPALEIMEILRSKGASLAYHDPHVPRLRATRRHYFDMSSVELEDSSVSAFDVVLIVTDHDAVNYAMVSRRAQLLVDTRGALRKRGISAPPEKTVSS